MRQEQTAAGSPRYSVIARSRAADDVLIEVGPAKTRYGVTKSFVSYYSEYFRKALNGPWKKANEEWRHAQKLPSGQVAWECAADDIDVCWSADMTKLKLYVFADRVV
ncbi:hypothetical protein EK21DRAFT_116790 [Setomelanomma holmii]|uniref:BTB domain-containing protein n=1 Tax=Setomelanomma holmii TaxID=210430 RepID=A0A9P4H1S8_9PLEO|nr:hypothetical protein EK21DRAFT_116790 [Setomelanomma holmii]